MSLHPFPLPTIPDAVAFRKFIDLIHQASSKQVNWDPLIDIRVSFPPWWTVNAAPIYLIFNACRWGTMVL
jgi:hypothetical protein